MNGKYTMFLDKKIQYKSNVTFPKLLYKRHAIPVKIPTASFVRLDTLIVTSTWERQGYEWPRHPSGSWETCLQKGGGDTGLMQHRPPARPHSTARSWACRPVRRAIPRGHRDRAFPLCEQPEPAPNSLTHTHDSFQEARLNRRRQNHK